MPPCDAIESIDGLGVGVKADVLPKEALEKLDLAEGCCLG